MPKKLTLDYIKAETSKLAKKNYITIIVNLLINEIHNFRYDIIKYLPLYLMYSNKGR